MITALAAFLLAVQPTPSVFDSLELMVADCDTIARGTIDNFEPIEGREAVNLRVVESLKGEESRSLSFNVPQSYSTRQSLEHWRARRTPLLVFLRRRNRPVGMSADGRGTHTLRTGELERSVLVLGRFPEIQTYATDLTPFRSGDVLLSRVRAAIRTAPAVAEPETHTIRIPHRRFQVVGRTATTRHLPTGLYGILRAPADAHLERLARAWTFASEWQLREEGARALTLFRSPENARRLRLLLRDPFRLRYADGSENFPVREIAKSILERWSETP